MDKSHKQNVDLQKPDTEENILYESELIWNIKTGKTNLCC